MGDLVLSYKKTALLLISFLFAIAAILSVANNNKILETNAASAVSSSWQDSSDPYDYINNSEIITFTIAITNNDPIANTYNLTNVLPQGFAPLNPTIDQVYDSSTSSPVGLIADLLSPTGLNITVGPGATTTLTFNVLYYLTSGFPVDGNLTSYVTLKLNSATAATSMLNMKMMPLMDYTSTLSDVNGSNDNTAQPAEVVTNTIKVMASQDTPYIVPANTIKVAALYNPDQSIFPEYTPVGISDDFATSTTPVTVTYYNSPSDTGTVMATIPLSQLACDNYPANANVCGYTIPFDIAGNQGGYVTFTYDLHVSSPLDSSITKILNAVSVATIGSGSNSGYNTMDVAMPDYNVSKSVVDTGKTTLNESPGTTVAADGLADADEYLKYTINLSSLNNVNNIYSVTDLLGDSNIDINTVTNLTINGNPANATDLLTGLSVNVMGNQVSTVEFYVKTKPSTTFDYSMSEIVNTVNVNGQNVSTKSATATIKTGAKPTKPTEPEVLPDTGSN